MPYLNEALESMAAQTYKNAKVLVWDDCSTDGSLEELQRWIPSRLPGQIFSGRTAKIGACLAFLVEQADTELLARMDADDICLPDRLQKQVEFMVNHPEVGVLSSCCIFIDPAGKNVKNASWFTEDAEIRWAMPWSQGFVHPSVMLRRPVVLQGGNYPVDFKWEDGLLFNRLALITEFRCLPEVLLKYRQHPSSNTGLVTDNGNAVSSRNMIPFEREVAVRMKPDLDPELGPELWDLDEFVAFWNSTHPRLADKAFQIPWRYKQILKDLAIRRARRIGKPDDYFQNTPLYRSQQYHLRRRWMENHGLGPVIRLRRSLALRAAVVTEQG